MTLSLRHLNAQQREAVLHKKGPLLILAGAGSGKTSTMTYRIAHLIAERHVAPENIVGLSFTNKAAKELKERVSSIVKKAMGPRASRGLTISTFHSLCVRLLRKHASEIGFQNSFSIVDQHDQKEIVKTILKNIHVDDRRFDPMALLFEISNAKNKFLNPSQAEEFFYESKRVNSEYADVLTSVYPQYQEQLRALNSMDFDDLLFNTARLLGESEKVRKFYNDKFRYLLVDEYQDTNPAQFKLIRYLTEKEQNICVVGDDDQSIYGWRGADASHILEFKSHYPDSRMITLDQNYRSTNTILDAANRVISHNRKRHPKSLWSDRGTGEPITQVILEQEHEESEFVAQEITRMAQEQNHPWKDFAVLYRSNPQSRLFEEALRRHRIPYRIVGTLSFLDRKEVKDALCYWKVILNPKDDASLRRIINWPARGIGRSTIEKLGNAAFERKISLFEAFDLAPELTPRSAQAIGDLKAKLTHLQEALKRTPATAEAISHWAKNTLQTMKFRETFLLEEEPKDAARKWDTVEELVHGLGRFRYDEEQAQVEGDAPSESILRDYLTALTLEAQDDKDEKDEKDSEKQNQVTLLTLHGSKGLEYPIVFLVGMEDGLLPHRRSIEEAFDISEERRLCYVGMTRAKDRLFLTRVKNRIRYGKPVPRVKSRFLDEMPQELITTRDESYPDPSSKEEQKAHEQKVKNYLAEIRSNLLKQTRPS